MLISEDIAFVSYDEALSKTSKSFNMYNIENFMLFDVPETRKFILLTGPCSNFWNVKVDVTIIRSTRIYILFKSFVSGLNKFKCNMLLGVSFSTYGKRNSVWLFDCTVKIFSQKFFFKWKQFILLMIWKISDIRKIGSRFIYFTWKNAFPRFHSVQYLRWVQCTLRDMVIRNDSTGKPKMKHPF